MICRLCPRQCGAARTAEEGRGFCAMPALPVVARAALHHWEEPCVSGTRGSGAVFFSGCVLGCVFCQNGAISRERRGRPVFASGREALDKLRVEDVERLSDAWAAFNREHNPSPLDGEEEVRRRKKAWGTRVMSAFSGACSGCSALCPRRNGRKR